MPPPDQFCDAQRMEEPLSEQQKAVRDIFVNEYLKDHNAYKACIRMGFLSTFAIDISKQLIGDGYVQRKLAYMSRQAKEEADSDFNAMLENLRDLAFNAPPSVRATATKTYMEAKGWLKKDGNGDEERTAAIVEALANFARNAPA